MVKESLEDHVWSLVLEFIKKGMREERRRIERGESLVPTITGVTYCPHCDRLSVASIKPMGAYMDSVRAFFPILVLEAIHSARGCKCGEDTFPIGYIASSEAWFLSVKDTKEEEIKAYYNVFGGISKCPKRRECHITAVSTTIGKKKLIMEEIIREGDHVKLKKFAVPEGAGLEGNFILPLPRIKLGHLLPPSAGSLVGRGKTRVSETYAGNR